MSASVSDTYDSAHLPECDLSRDCGLFHGQDYCHNCEQSCICAALRACEQRVQSRYSAYLNADNEGSYAYGFRDGVYAAREAVVALPMMKIAGNFPLYDADEVIAAIDALKEKP